MFELISDGLMLTEIAPGIDVDDQILSQWASARRLGEIVEMDVRIVADGPMELKVDLLHLDHDDRISMGPDGRVLFVNFEKMRVRSIEDIGQIRDRVEAICASLDGSVDVVVNYDGTWIDEDIEDAYAQMVHDLEERFYGTVMRYSGSAFMRMKLGRSIRRDSRPHIFESGEKAHTYLDRPVKG